MNRKCSQCKDMFEESTISHYRRMAKDSPILCKSCYRITHAEKRAAKREYVRKSNILRELESENVRISHIIEAGPLVYMRKNKVSYEQSVESIKKLKEITFHV